MTNEDILLDSLNGKVKCYGINVPASLNDAGQKIIYLTCTDNDITTVSLDSLISHQLFKTFSNKSQLQLNSWNKE